MGSIDMDFGVAIARLAKALAKSHGALRAAYKSGASGAVIERLRSGIPLTQTENNELADLLEGLLDEKGRGFDPDVIRQVLVSRVKALKLAAKGQTPMKKLEEIYQEVANTWNDDPKHANYKFQPDQIKQFHRHAEPARKK